MADTLNAGREEQTPKVDDEEKPFGKDVKNINVEEDKKLTENGNTDEVNDDNEEPSFEELGSLEKPIEILSRKRERKSTDRYVDKSEEQAKTEDELDYTKGKGIKLGEIEFIRNALDKAHTDDLKPLHRLLYRREGKAAMTKKNIRAFCGYPFDKDSNHYARTTSQLDRFVNAGLKFIMGVLGLEKKGDREDLKSRIIDFLMKPQDHGKSVPQKKGKQGNTKKTPKKRKSADSGKKKAKKEKSANEISSSENDENDDEKGEKKSSPKKNYPKDKKKKPTPVKIATPKNKTPKKNTPNKKDAKRKGVDEGSDDDDEPLMKKSKSEPSNDDIKNVVADILKDADLEQVTMKTVCKQVYDHFPDFDLTSRKDFIKTTVKEIIS